MLNDFTPTEISQLNLFDDTQPRSNSKQLMKVVDGINHSGKGKLDRGNIFSDESSQQKTLKKHPKDGKTRL